MPMSEAARRAPIFIHGILPRSGTNFLYDLLLLHPDCASARRPVKEDLFLDHSDHLVAFTKAVRAAWDPRWGTFGADIPDQLCAGIGEGLLSFLTIDPHRRLVTKSPSVRRLARFFTFFPSARLLILVRDGRSVVQSGMETFGWDFDRGCRMWSEAATAIQQFQHAEVARADQWRLVRYEDLLDDTEGQLQRIFEFLDLDPAGYDFAAARNLPVRGSSAFGRESRAVHWEPVARDSSFAPKERWRSWSPKQLERFDWLAGNQLRDFGYASQPPRTSVTRSMKHVLLDWRWSVGRSIRLTIYRTRMRLQLRRRLGLLRET
jgi:hypothetical protein